MHKRLTIGAWLAVLLCCLPLTTQATSSLEGNFEIHSAYIVFDHGVVQLNAHVEYPIGDRIRSALLDGVTLAFDFDVSVSQPRRLWFNATLLDLNLRRELSYHAVSDRYVLRDGNGVELESFPNVEAALDKLGRIEDLPIMVESQLHGDGPWEVSVRASIRRGRIPDVMRALVFWSDDWHRTSEWYTWTLTH